MELSAATAGSVPSVTAIQSGGVLQVDAGVTVPAYAAATNTSNTDMFNYWNGSASAGTLMFASGSRLVLGAGSTWARAITVGTAQ